MSTHADCYEQLALFRKESTPGRVAAALLHPPVCKGMKR